MEPRTEQETDRRWILVVDADAQTQRILDLSLRNSGFEVKTAGSAIEALTWLGDNRADLIIADTELAGTVDGFELCRRIKQQTERAAIPFIFLAEPTVENKMRGVEVGADDFLTKPLYVQEVLVRARALLQRGERERLLAQAQENERFAGALEDIPLTDLLRAIEANAKSGVVHLTAADGARGEIYFRQGAVVDAEAGRLSGREAVYRLFSWSHGQLEVEWKSIRRRDTIELEPNALLMEALRRVDEWRRLLGGVAPLDTIFEVDYRLLAERLAEIPDEVNSILRLFDGVRTFMQVIDDCGLGDLEAVAVIGKLHRERIIADINVKPESEEIPGADIEGWLSEATGPFRNAPEPARRDLFGSGSHAGGVHERITAPLDPLEEGGREALADDMRARFTDRLNAEGHSRGDDGAVGQAPSAAASLSAAGAPRPSPAAVASSAAPAPAPPPPPRAPVALPVSENTLQGIPYQPYQQQRPSTSPGFSPTAASSKGALPEVTPTMRAPAGPSAPAASPSGTGDGIPEAVVPLEGEPAIVIPFPSPAAAIALHMEPLGAAANGTDDARAVAGEIVARVSAGKLRESEASEQRLAQIREAENEQQRATEPGLGPESESPPPPVPLPPEPPSRSEHLHPLEVDGQVMVEEIAPWPKKEAKKEPKESKKGPPPPPREQTSSRAATASAETVAADTVNQADRRSPVRKILVGLAAMGAVLGVGWVMMNGGPASKENQAGRPGGEVAAEAPSTPAGTAGGSVSENAGAAGAGAAATPRPGETAPASSPTTAASDKPIPAAQTQPKGGAGALRGAAGRGTSPASPLAADELDERGADPKRARSLPDEFPQLLAACRAAFADKRMKDAEVACVAAKDANTDSAEAHALLAHALFNRNRRREALVQAERAIKLDPQVADAYFIVGGVHQAAGETAAAKAAYAKYLKLAPTGPYAADLRAIVDGLK